MKKRDSNRPALGWLAGSSVLLFSLAIPAVATAQVPTENEVRQLVTFEFLPGKSSEAFAIFRDQAIPLYEQNEAMLSFRGFREVESPIALDLIVVSAFNGMAGMDESNSTLGAAAREAGTSLGAIYGRIASFSSGHTDQFVEMLPALGNGDASAERLTAFIWYRVSPEKVHAFEQAIQRLAEWERENGTAASTGRFLVSDGWDYMRFVGFNSLGDYQRYWAAGSEGGHARVDQVTSERREVIVSSSSALSVR